MPNGIAAPKAIRRATGGRKAPVRREVWEIHPAPAAGRGIKDGDRVMVKSPRG